MGLPAGCFIPAGTTKPSNCSVTLRFLHLSLRNLLLFSPDPGGIKTRFPAIHSWLYRMTDIITRSVLELCLVPDIDLVGAVEWHKA